MDFKTIVFAFGLTLFAGLSTGIGSALAFFTKRTNTKFLSIALGFSAGVMIYISFVEMFAVAREHLVRELGNVGGNWAVVASFFAGILIVAVIDRIVPSFENPHEIRKVEDMENTPDNFQKLYRVGMLAAIALAIHNFPEGIATFASVLVDVKIGIPIAIAIAIHNIPEGIAVSIPIYYATGDKNKAFYYSFLSGAGRTGGGFGGISLTLLVFQRYCFRYSFCVSGRYHGLYITRRTPARIERIR